LLLRDLLENSRDEGGGIRGRVIFVSPIEEGRVRKKVSILLLGEGHYISVTPFTISTPSPC